MDLLCVESALRLRIIRSFLPKTSIERRTRQWQRSTALYVVNIRNQQYCTRYMANIQHNNHVINELEMTRVGS